MRLRTHWFLNDEARGARDRASVLAATLWKLGDRLVENLSRAGYAIDTPERGLGIIAELLAFGLHCADRFAYARLSAEDRLALVQAIGARLTALMNENARNAGFVAFLNRRAEAYARLEFPQGEPEFAALRLFASEVRERMDPRDQPWIMDQLIEIESPAALALLRKALEAVLPRAPQPLRPSPAAAACSAGRTRGRTD